MATYQNGTVLRYELYDLLNDLGETTDLKDKFPTISNELLNQIEEWKKSVMESVDKVGCLGTGDTVLFSNKWLPLLHKYYTSSQLMILLLYIIIVIKELHT